MEEAAIKRDVRLFYERDLAFHRQCWELAGNKFLSRAYDRFKGTRQELVPSEFPTLAMECEVAFIEKSHVSLYRRFFHLLDGFLQCKQVLFVYARLGPLQRHQFKFGAQEEQLFDFIPRELDHIGALVHNPLNETLLLKSDQSFADCGSAAIYLPCQLPLDD